MHKEDIMKEKENTLHTYIIIKKTYKKKLIIYIYIYWIEIKTKTNCLCYCHIGNSISLDNLIKRINIVIEIKLRY